MGLSEGLVGTAPCAVLGAKVQIGLRPVQRCKCESIEYGVSSIGRGGLKGGAQRGTGDRIGCCGHEIILRSQVSAVGYQVQVFRYGYRYRVGPTILGWPRPSRDARPYPRQGDLLKGRPETGKDAAGDAILQVTGDGHRGIGHSGVGCSATGHRLRVPAAGPRAAGA